MPRGQHLPAVHAGLRAAPAVGLPHARPAAATPAAARTGRDGGIESWSLDPSPADMFDPGLLFGILRQRGCCTRVSPLGVRASQSARARGFPASTHTRWVLFSVFSNHSVFFGMLPLLICVSDPLQFSLITSLLPGPAKVYMHCHTMFSNFSKATPPGVGQRKPLYSLHYLLRRYASRNVLLSMPPLPLITVSLISPGHSLLQAASQAPAQIFRSTFDWHASYPVATILHLWPRLYASLHVLLVSVCPFKEHKAGALQPNTLVGCRAGPRGKTVAVLPPVAASAAHHSAVAMILPCISA